MSPLILPIVGAGVRWLLTIAGAAGVAASEDTVTQFASLLVSIGALGWSIYQKIKAERKLKKKK